MFIRNGQMVNLMLLHYLGAFHPGPFGAAGDDGPRHDLANESIRRIAASRHDLVPNVGGGHNPVGRVPLPDVDHNAVDPPAAHQGHRVRYARVRIDDYHRAAHPVAYSMRHPCSLWAMELPFGTNPAGLGGLFYHYSIRALGQRRVIMA